MTAFLTLVELLRWRALQQPEQHAYTSLEDGETVEHRLTYGELDRQARAIGATLQDLEATGERVLLLYPSGLEYIAAFFGCLYAGAVAVPIYPPRLHSSLDRFRTIAADAQATVALTTPSLVPQVQRWLQQAPELQDLEWVATGSEPASAEMAWHMPEITGQTLAFLQYTSGATGVPKGVMLSHSTLLYNERMMQHAFQHSERSLCVGWLPLYHDMGLIGNVLQPLYAGFPCVLLSPVAFLQRPVRWLQAISRYRASTSGGPNFAYDLCVRKVTPAQRATLDLSSWEIAVNGAEPVRQETLERFAATFAACGFRREAFYPCYGLAEATLIVTGGLKTAPPVVYTVRRTALEHHQVVPADADSEDAQPLVGCGQTLLDQRVVIVDPDSGVPCPPAQVGEIWVAGPSVAHGYWGRSAETVQTFQAQAVGCADTTFLRTGDLGFLQDGELFVTGRCKDVIIIRGCNLYPQDIERTVERCHPALRPGCGAAFAVDLAGAERLVVVQEVERASLAQARRARGQCSAHGSPQQRAGRLAALDFDNVIGNIRQSVAEEHGVQVYAVLLLKAGGLPKTSSGKIQRHACRIGFLTGHLEVVRAWYAEVVPPSQDSQSEGCL
jgi:acyl-CoA synthetase (AMP-forming)/AMP-acid ligase II